jgi:cytochrome b subunit of formate dehydrogenase
MLGGLQMVRLIHHLTMYGLLFFVTIHIYMQVWKAVYYTESDISSIIGGYKIFPKKYIGHFADYYGIYLHEEAPSMKEMDSVSTEMKEAPG